MTTIEKCPFCGSGELTAESERRVLSVPYGVPVPYDSPFFECRSCGEQATADQPEKAEALKRATVESVNAMLDLLNARDITTAYLLRALRIPQRTATRWKRGQISASALALIRIIRTYPSLLEVADSDFNPEMVLRRGPQSNAVNTAAASSVNAKIESSRSENRLYVQAAAP